MIEKLDGFRMPAEWEPQKSIWIAWPYNKKDWPDLFYFIPEVVAKICLLYTSPSPRDRTRSRMPSSA